MNILILDIENTFITAGVWGLWGVNVNNDLILDSGKVLCFAAKWLGEKEIIFAKYTDSWFLPMLHALLDKADAVVTYNGRRHDLPLINREFLKAGMGPPSPVRHIDLLETAKKQFKFPSNKMDWLLKELDLPQKVEHEGFQLWIKVLRDEPQAWKDMEEYNIGDVDRTERLYYRLLPWILGHPNNGVYANEGSICPSCGSSHVQRRGYYFTNAGRWPRFQCVDCKKWSRGRVLELDKEQRKKMLVDAS